MQTSQPIDNSYHCRCNASGPCPYDFWSNKVSTEEAAVQRASVSCQQAGDYACFNNGTCVDQPSGSASAGANSLAYSCECGSFFTGMRCETFDPCVNSPCAKESECLARVTADEQMTYECKCGEGFVGRNCTIDVSIWKELNSLLINEGQNL